MRRPSLATRFSASSSSFRITDLVRRDPGAPQSRVLEHDNIRVVLPAPLSPEERRKWLRAEVARSIECRRGSDSRHTTGTFLLKAGAPLAIVQRILRLSSPTITVMVYGHLDLGDMTDALSLLSFTPRPTEAADELSARRGAPVVRKTSESDSEPDAAEDKTPQRRGLEDSGPSWIRTRDQSVMSRQL